MSNSDNEYDIIEDIPQRASRKQRKSHISKSNYDSDSSIEDYEEPTDEKGPQVPTEDQNGGASNEKDAIEGTNGRSNTKESEDSDSDMFSDDDAPETNKQDGETNEANETKNSSSNYFEEDTFNGEDRHVSYNDIEESQTEALHKYFNNVEDFDEGRSQKLDKTKIGLKIESFDLEQEEKDGKFDEEGNYIRNDSSDSENDNQDHWIDESNNADILKAKKAQEKREEKEKEKLKALEFSSIEDILFKLISLLEPAENPLEALSRFQSIRKSQRKNKSNSNEDIGKSVFEITGYCDSLINEKGLTNAYDLTREELMRQYKSESGIDYQQQTRGLKRKMSDESDKEEPSAKDDSYYNDKVWEYKWADEEEIHGVFSSYEMNYWVDTYFDDSVIARKIGEEEFKKIKTLQFE